MNSNSAFLKLRLRIAQLLIPKNLLPTQAIKIGFWECLKAINQQLDELIEVETCFPEMITYNTVHGFRSVNKNYPEFSQFVVIKSEEKFGFAKPEPLPYSYLPTNKSQHSVLVVTCYPTDEATSYGYAEAVELPYRIETSSSSFFPPGAIVISVTADNTEALKAGFANAIYLEYFDND